MKLYQRLTVLMAVLLVIGLFTADALTYNSLRSFLYGRIDAQIEGSQHQAVRYFDDVHREHKGTTLTALDDRVSPDAYLLLVGRNGKVTLQRPSGSADHPDPTPVLPTTLHPERPGSPNLFGSRHGTYRPNPTAFEMKSVAGAGTVYRAEAIEVPQGVLVTAVSLNPTTDTLASLRDIELLATLIVLAALCVLALWIVRRGLRPLASMARTAGAIASGDLTRRVTVHEETSEVGHLGSAFNAMITQIEAAFAEQRASEERLRQFVADASHELRTPLTSIRGYSELMRKGGFADDEGRARAVERIEQEATRMGVLVDDLLLLARLDQGRPLQRVPVDLSQVFTQAVVDARATDPDRPVDLDVTVPVSVLGDEDRLAQVAHNLVRNAYAHTPRGTPVHVKVFSDDGMGVAEIRDEGPGIPSALVPRVFDRFTRGDFSRTGAGTGLGLSIVRAIAEALDGEALASSEAGKGATFTVRIPLAT